MTRERGEAFEGKGYGTLRYRLYSAARLRIEKSITAGYYCEAIAIIESVIADRLESRLSFLKEKNFGFKTLGALIVEVRKIETDEELLSLIDGIDSWRDKRNKALHELVKVERGQEPVSWAKRMKEIGVTAKEGYQLLIALYRRVADLNPSHSDRVF